MDSQQQAKGTLMMVSVCRVTWKEEQRQNTAQLGEATGRLSRGLYKEGHVLTGRKFLLWSHLTK